ncbi:MAG: hypothetical protein ACRC67_33405 [Inquilinus sp.]|uniref:hypothetical protein n=1 Tax=Inquilinus sp. TaxID=1932117 RepID=UPI003F362077
MAIRLNLQRDPFWLDLPYGVQFRVRPCTTAIWEQALARGRRLGLELGIHAEAIETAGGAVSGLPALTDPDAIAGLSQMLFAQALAQCAAIEWRGVLNEEGTAPEPLSEPAVATAMEMFPEIASDFVAKYTRTMGEAIVEGKGSGTSPIGTGAAVPTTAEGAGNRTSPAAEARP